MTTLAQDTFTRANNASSWGTASDGNTWATAVANGVALSISSNEGVATEGSSFASMLLGSGTSGDTEGLVRFTFTTVGPKPGIILRSSANGQSFYVCRVNSSTVIGFARYNAVTTGNGTFLQNGGAYTFTANTFYWMRFRVTGATTPRLQARLWQDGNTEPTTWDNDFTDSSGSQLTSAGQYGLYIGTIAGTSKFDTLSFNDTTTGPTNNTMAFEDDLVISSRLSAADSTLFTDATATSESMSSTSGFIPPDMLTISDSFSSTDSAMFTDANTVSDVLSSQRTFVPSDNLGITESFSSQDGYSTTEALSALDAFLAQNGANWVEVNSITESMSSSGVFIHLTSLAALDSFLGTGTLIATEANSISDVFISAIGGNVVEGLSISDVFVALTNYAPVEMIPGNDSFLGQGVSLLVESLTMTDLQSALQSWGVESLVISDSVSTTGTFQPITGLGVADSFLGGDLSLWVEVVPISESFSGKETAIAFLPVLSPFPLGSSPATYQGTTVTPTRPSGVYRVNGVILDSQPIICTAPRMASGLQFLPGSTFFLLFDRPTVLTQTLLADQSVVTMTFATARGQMIEGAIQVASTLSLSGNTSTLAVVCTLLSSAVSLAL